MQQELENTLHDMKTFLNLTSSSSESDEEKRKLKKIALAKKEATKKGNSLHIVASRRRIGCKLFLRHPWAE